MTIRFEKRCPRCGLTLPLTDFARNGGRPDGRTDYCREDQNAVVRESRARRKAAYQAELAKLSPADRQRLGYAA